MSLEKAYGHLRGAYERMAANPRLPWRLQEAGRLMLAKLNAQAIEAQRAETPQSGSVEDESAVAKPCAQKRSA